MQVKKTDHPNAAYRLKVNVDGEGDRMIQNVGVKQLLTPLTPLTPLIQLPRETVSWFPNVIPIP